MSGALSQLLGNVPGAGASPSLLALLMGQRQASGPPAVSPLSALIQPQQRAGGMNPMGLPAAQAPQQPNPGANAGGMQLPDLLKLLNQSNNQNQAGGGFSLMDWLNQILSGNSPAISGINTMSLVPPDASMTAAPSGPYVGGVGGPGY